MFGKMFFELTAYEFGSPARSPGRRARLLPYPLPFEFSDL
jgi:hypothetical protein